MGKVTAGAVIFVGNVERVAGFYRSVAAMAVVAGDESHQVLEIEGFQLVIHRIPGEVESEQPAVSREDSYIKICLPVANLDEARASAAENGGVVKGKDFEWEARGFRACDGNDPEGNIIQLRVPA